MKRFFNQITSISACLILLAGCAKGPDRDIEYNIFVTHSVLNMLEGEEITIIASPTDQTFTWASTDVTIATVSSSGVVKALKEGSCFINVNSSEGLSRTITVDVIKYYPLEGIDVFDAQTLAPVTSLSFTLSQSITLDATPTPKNYNEKIPFNIVWQSSNENVVVVDQNGKVTPVDFGIAEITVSVVDKPTVKATIPTAIMETPITEIVVSQTSLDMMLNETYTVTTTLMPADYSVKDASLMWESSNPSVVGVTNGIIEALEPGFATVTVSLNDNPSVKTDIQVSIATPSVVTIDLSSFAAAGGEAPNAIRSKVNFQKGSLVEIPDLSPAQIEASKNRDFFLYNAEKNRLVFTGDSGEYDVFYSSTYSYFYILRENDVAPACYWLTGSGHWLSPVPYSSQPGDWNMDNFLKTGYVRPIGDGKYQITIYLTTDFDIQLYANRGWGGVITYPITSALGIVYHSNGRDIVQGSGFVPGNYRITLDVPGEKLHFEPY